MTDEVIDLLDWFGDPKKRRKSSAVEKSNYVRKQYAALTGTVIGPDRKGGGSSKAGKAGRAASNSTLSSYSG